MEVLVGILFLNSILMGIIIFLLDGRIKRMYNVLADLAVDIVVYENFKEHERREQKEKSKKAVNKVGNWKK